MMKIHYFSLCLFNKNPIIRDCNSFEEYNQEHRILTEINSDNPFLIYKLFLSDRIIDFIVSEIKYEKCETQASSSFFRKHKQQWTPTTQDEMHIFIDILLIMDVVKVPEIRLHWKDPMFSNEHIKNAIMRE